MKCKNALDESQCKQSESQKIEEMSQLVETNKDVKISEDTHKTEQLFQLQAKGQQIDKTP